tara:strand:+ start:569 stop:1267 length:699 start_codon:yes stop_codon:yes gene_type:complete
MANKGWFEIQILSEQYKEDYISSVTGKPYKISQCSKCGGSKKKYYNYEDLALCSCSETELLLTAEELGQIIPADEKIRDLLIKVLSLPKSEHSIDDLIPFLEKQAPIEYANMSKFSQAIFDRQIHVIIERTDLLTLYYGTNLTKPLKPHIQKCLSHNKCTYTITRDVFIRQKGFRCLTCWPKDKTMAVCESCVKTCHRGHDTYLPIIRHGDRIKPQKLFMFCDCSVTKKCCL